MERNQVLNEYWELRKVLNLGNKVANEQTELIFKIEILPGSEYRMIAAVISKSEIQKIELVRRNFQGDWERSGFTKLKEFENYCAEFLNDWLESSNQDKKKILTKNEIKKLCEDLQNDIDLKLIGYEF